MVVVYIDEYRKIILYGTCSRYTRVYEYLKKSQNVYAVTLRGLRSWANRTNDCSMQIAIFSLYITLVQQSDFYSMYSYIILYYDIRLKFETIKYNICYIIKIVSLLSYNRI